ncbi:hypothetical protein [Dyadobacter sp. CY347]|uniref:LpxL/LpxP family acyltransferase n=1 Tax=Dyadobacter sp. CY347 TaxID=2909336 RepID=UPI0038D41105
MILILSKNTSGKTTVRKTSRVFISDSTPVFSLYYNAEYNYNTYIQTGAARMAIRRNSAVVYLNVQKQGVNRYNFRFNLLVKDAAKMSETEIMKLYYTELEKNIRHQPELWLWSHNRWKFGFPATLPTKKHINVV